MTRYAVAHCPGNRIQDSITDKCICPSGRGRPGLHAFKDDKARQKYIDTHGVIRDSNGYPEQYYHIEGGYRSPSQEVLRAAGSHASCT